MHFNVKNYLKSTRNHTAKHALLLCVCVCVINILIIFINLDLTGQSEF